LVNIQFVDVVWSTLRWVAVHLRKYHQLCNIDFCKEQKDLLEHMDLSHAECLNENPQKPLAYAMKQGYREDDGLALESDADEQLLIHIPFTQVVKMHTLCLKAVDGDRAPKVVKLFTNRPSLGFSDVSDLAAQQEIELSAAQLEKGEPIQLKFVKFQNVRSLTLFIESNQNDEDTTALHRIQLLGSLVETTNMSEFKKVG